MKSNNLRRMQLPRDQAPATTIPVPNPRAAGVDRVHHTSPGDVSADRLQPTASGIRETSSSGPALPASETERTIVAAYARRRWLSVDGAGDAVHSLPGASISHDSQRTRGVGAICREPQPAPPPSSSRARSKSRKLYDGWPSNRN